MELEKLNNKELIKIINEKNEYIKELENKLSFVIDLAEEEEEENLIWS
ncbi:MAG: hypothetical protein J6M16_09825 [Clostridia bacterium]|nr:hypothetical protein [Clostridia bacterium]